MAVRYINFISLFLCLVLPQLGLWNPAGSAPREPLPLAESEIPSSSMTFTVSCDSWTSSNTSDTNNGDDVDLWVGVFSYGEVKVERRTLLWFDISNLPDWATVDSAVLELAQTRADGVQDYQIWPYQITASWQEDGVTWQNAPPNLSAGDPAACLDYQPGIKQWDVTSIVQAWQAGAENHGILLAGDGTTVGTRVFRSRENISDPPQLTISYHNPDSQLLYLPLVINPGT